MNGHRFRVGTRVPAAATVAVTAALAVGGAAHADDDIESQSARQISERAEEAVRSATSVHITAKGDLDGAAPSGELDLRLDREGNCTGSVSMGDEGSVEIIKRGETVWVKPDEAFWKNQLPGAGEEAAEIVKGRYLRGTTDDAMLSGLAEVCDLDAFLDSVSDARGAQVPLTKGRKTKVDGVDVIPVTGKHEGRTATMYVATEGKPYPVRLNATGPGSKKATVVLSDYDKPVPSATPPADRSVDISSLMDLRAEP
ncbi:hypothetical protein ACFU5O_14170 [Streptomyces sp. NPDC057445]|uniref:hypothetical protein n=1 Tax=Streptomyces sp. NPDC057445 TaxID=3346136 RepID=UPI003698CD28